MLARLGVLARLGGCARLTIIWLLVLALVTPAAAAPSGPPIRIGGTLALTGPLAPTALLHKIAGEIYVEELNRGNGLLGRPVEWVLLDDQSKPDVTRSLYEKLITVDKVDLLIGPYATGGILAAMGVAQRYNKVFVHHSFGMPHLAKYEMHFPTAAFGIEPNVTLPTTVYNALAATSNPPKTVAIVTSKFPSAQFQSSGARDVAEKRGLKVVLYLEYEFGNRDWGALAARIKDAKPDFLWVGSLGLDSNQLLEAMKKLDYTPPRHFHLFPAPGPLAVAPEGKLALSSSVFEEHPPFTSNPGAAKFIPLFRDRATRANVPYPFLDTQVAGSFAAWQVLEAAVTATKSLDDKVLGQWLRANRVDTLIGKLRFDGPNNYGDDLFKVKQVHDGKWVVVWPKEFAAPGARLLPP
ncbi:MAG TPA: amino acid ABC transporter substrate-binding protein [Methylomirabilota bacterium]|jgi:branched-chain amino acid transport system substrate-binding protein|nr:amino acid ABC transporter substrate-binding protein [Methylomirabilota bacterium]